MCLVTINRLHKLPVGTQVSLDPRFTGGLAIVGTFISVRKLEHENYSVAIAIDVSGRRASIDEIYPACAMVFAWCNAYRTFNEIMRIQDRES
jgi:hypothetical protein